MMVERKEIGEGWKRNRDIINSQVENYVDQ
jgi:hypothetical protein